MAQLTDKQQAFLDALFTEECKGDFKKAKIKAGYNINTPMVDILSPKLVQAVLQKKDQYLAVNAPAAAYALVDVLEDPLQGGAGMKRAVANDILDSQADKLLQRQSLPNAIIVIPAKKAIEELPEPGITIEHGEIRNSETRVPITQKQE